MNPVLSHVLVGIGTFVLGLIAKTYNPFEKTGSTGTTKKAKPATGTTKKAKPAGAAA